VQQPCLPADVVGDMQVGSSDIPDEQRVAAEHEPRLLGIATPVGDCVRMVSGRVPRRCDRSHERVSELHDIAVGERDVLERDPDTGGQVGRGACALDQCGQTGYVVGLQMRLEHGHDRRSERHGRGEVVVDEVGMRVDDGQLAVRTAAEQVAGT
jgi:hypothetical protein